MNNQELIFVFEYCWNNAMTPGDGDGMGKWGYRSGNGDGPSACGEFRDADSDRIFVYKSNTGSFRDWWVEYQ